MDWAIPRQPGSPTDYRSANGLHLQTYLVDRKKPAIPNSSVSAIVPPAGQMVLVGANGHLSQTSKPVGGTAEQVSGQNA